MKKTLLKSTYVLLLLVLIVVLMPYISGSEVLKSLSAQFGFVGLIIAAALNSFNIFFPLPLSVFTPLFLESGFHFAEVVGAIALGMTLGDVLGYAIGAGGRKVLEKSEASLSSKMKYFHENHAMLPYMLLFVYVMFAPTPNELLVIPMGFAGYKLRYIFPVVLLGNIMFVLLTALGITYFT